MPDDRIDSSIPVYTDHSLRESLRMFGLGHAANHADLLDHLIDEGLIEEPYRKHNDMFLRIPVGDWDRLMEHVAFIDAQLRLGGDKPWELKKTA